MKIGFVTLCLVISSEAIKIREEPHDLCQNEANLDGKAEGKGEFLSGLAHWLTTPTMFNRNGCGGGCGGGCGMGGGCGGGMGGGCGGGCGGGMGGMGGMMRSPGDQALYKIGETQRAADIMKKAA